MTRLDRIEIAEESASILLASADILPAGLFAPGVVILKFSSILLSYFYWFCPATCRTKRATCPRSP